MIVKHFYISIQCIAILITFAASKSETVFDSSDLTLFYDFDGVTTTINLTVPVCENRNRLSLPCCEATDGKAADFPGLKAIP